MAAYQLLHFSGVNAVVRNWDCWITRFRDRVRKGARGRRPEARSSCVPAYRDLHFSSAKIHTPNHKSGVFYNLKEKGFRILRTSRREDEFVQNSRSISSTVSFST